MMPRNFAGLRTLCAVLFAATSVAYAQDRSWNLNGDGSYDLADNWDPTDVPDTSIENAIITSPDGTTAVVVTLGPSVARDVGNLTILSNGANPVHELSVSDNTFLDVHGDIANDGILSFNSTGSSTLLRLDGSDLTVTGSGVIRLGGSNSGISSTSGLDTLFNTASHTIEGAGNLGLNSLVINNAGLIDANLAAEQLVLDPSSIGATNTGTMRASGGGILTFTGNGTGAFDNTGGVIEAVGVDSTVLVTSSASITGGTVRGTGGGVVAAGASQNAFFTDVTFEGEILGNDNSDLGIAGSITNNGTITMASNGSNTDLEIQGDTTIGGTGQVVLTATTGNNAGINGSGTLTNAAGHTIAGQGTFGENAIGIINDGLIDANVAGEGLFVDPNSAVGLTNNATMRASNGGLLQLTNSGLGSFTNGANGVIEAVGAGSEVQVLAGATVIDGTVRGTDGGVVRVAASQGSSFIDVAFEGAIQGDDNSDLGLSGAITNSGTITMTSDGSLTDVVLLSDVALGGAGEIVLSATTANNAGITGAGVLTNGADHTISGQGSIGRNSIGVVNNGTIEANVLGQVLSLDPNAGDNFTNNANLRATGGGILSLTGSGTGVFNNSAAGIIEAVGAGSEVQLITSASVTGGTVRGVGGGLVRVNSSQNAFFTDVTFEGAVQSDDNSDFGIAGTITNNAVITMVSNGSNSDVEIQGDTNVNGTGRIVLSATTGNNAGINGNGILTNGAGHTIEGQGTFGENAIGIVNNGLIDANVSGAAIVVDPNANDNLTNNATMRASGGGILGLTGSGTGGFDNTNGVIEAVGAGSEVQLFTNAAVTGGVVRGTDGGLVRANSSQNVFFADVTFEGAVQSDDNTDFGISGTITNNGVITLRSAGSNTDLELQTGGATLAGAGKVVLSATTGNNAGINGSGILTNEAEHTIEGHGTFGENTIGIDNRGLIDGNVAGLALVIDPNSTDGFVSTGTLRASSGGTVLLTNNGLGTFTNNGVFESLDGSTLQFASGGVLTNLNAGTLTGGSYRSVESGNGSMFIVLGSAVDTIAAGTSIELSGANATMTFGGTAVADSLMNNAGTLRILNGHVFTMANALNNTGVVELGGAGLAGGTLTSGGAITNAAGAEIFGHGTINNTILNSGLVRAANGTLAIVGGAIDGQSGTIQVDAGASLDLSGASGDSDGDFLTHNGDNLNLGSNNVLVGMDYTNANFGTGNSFDHRANVTGTGLILADPATTQTLTGDVSDGTTATASIDFGNARVGSQITRSYAVNNGGSDGPSLRGAVQTDNAAGNGGNITDARLTGAGVTAANFGPIAPSSAASSLDVVFDATSAGELSGQQVAIVNNFDNVGNQTIALNGAAYDAAQLGVAPTNVDLGILHVGETVTPAAVTISNATAAGSFSEDLLVDNFQATGDALIGAGSPSSLALLAGASDMSLLAAVDTSTAGNKSGSITFDATSNAAVDGVAIDGLDPLALAGGEVIVTAVVNEFAAPDVVQLGGDGTLTVDGPAVFSLDLGAVVVGAPDLTAELGVINDVVAPADDLAGSFTTNPSGGIGFSGFGDFADLAPGDTLGGLLVTLDTSVEGSFNAQFLLDPRSENASGFSGALPQIVVNVSGTVVIPEPATIVLVGLSAVLVLGYRRLSTRKC